MKPRRSMLFIPGANAAMLSTSFVYGADAVMFDLEDAVSLREKDTARLLVYQNASAAGKWVAPGLWRPSSRRWGG